MCARITTLSLSPFCSLCAFSTYDSGIFYAFSCFSSCSTSPWRPAASTEDECRWLASMEMCLLLLLFVRRRLLHTKARAGFAYSYSAGLFFFFFIHPTFRSIAVLLFSHRHSHTVARSSVRVCVLCCVLSVDRFVFLAALQRRILAFILFEIY